MQKYRLSPQWALSLQGEELIISGGADQTYSVPLPQGNDSFFAKLQYGKTFTRSHIKDELDIFEQLLAAQVILPDVAKKKMMKVGVVPKAARTLFPNITVVPEKEADMLIVVRTNETYSELLLQIEYAFITKPHIFVDLAYNQNLSVGPLVFMGETACISCLQGRVTERWGDPSPPPAPKMSQKYTKLTEAIVMAELERIQEDADYSLVNTTVSWDIANRSAEPHPLLTLSFCPVCNKTGFAQDGRLVLV